MFSLPSDKEIDMRSILKRLRGKGGVNSSTDGSSPGLHRFYSCRKCINVFELVGNRRKTDKGRGDLVDLIDDLFNVRVL